MTKFIEQRVDELENQVAKLELIIHELRGKKSIEPSTTNTVEDKPKMMKLVNGEFQPVTYEEIAEMMSLTPNQQRAEIIEKAKRFVAERQVAMLFGHVDFIVKPEKRTVVALIKPTGLKQVVERGIAKCNPSDVFNEHIGKAIALGRALGLDVSEFEQAVQPNRRTDGMVIEWRGKKRIISRNYNHGETCDFDSEMARYGTIINDTNAIYEV